MIVRRRHFLAAAASLAALPALAQAKLKVVATDKSGNSRTSGRKIKLKL